jgi:hypothetical protein
MRVGKVAILGFMFLFFGEGLIANAVIGPAKNPLTPEVSIVWAEFGLFNFIEFGEQVFVPGHTVPYNENQSYGWIILLETKKSKIRWREEFTLPAAPETWSSTEWQGSQFISGDKRMSIIEREVEPVQGLISHSWEIAPGDPKGRYIIRVIVENCLQEVFEFEVK